MNNQQILLNQVELRDKRIAELESMLESRTKEVDGWITKFDKAVNKQRLIITELEKANAELEKERDEHLASIETGKKAVSEIDNWIAIRDLEQQKIGIQNATTKVDTHRPFRPISSYDGDTKIDADMWRKAYKKGYDDALVEVKHEGVKLRNQAKELRGE